MSTESEPATGPPEVPAPAHREVRYEYSRNLAPLLTHLGVSLVVSTYQAGKLVVVGVDPQGRSPCPFTTSSGPWAWPSGRTGWPWAP